MTPGRSPSSFPWLVAGVGAIVTIVFAVLYSGMRGEYQEAEEGRLEAVATTHAFQEKLRVEVAARERADLRIVETVWLADLAQLRTLREEIDALFPLHPRLLPRLEDWITRAKDLTHNQELHRRTLTKLEIYAKEGKHPASASERDRLQKSLRVLVDGIDALLDAKNGQLAVVEKRMRTIRDRRRISLEVYGARWRETTSAISDREKCPQYDGLVLAPQFGLVPLGPDPKSGNQEFAHLASGEIPERAEGGPLGINEATGIVFVLTPLGHLMVPGFLNGLWGIQTGKVTKNGLTVAEVAYASTGHKMGLKRGDELVEFEESIGGEKQPAKGELRLEILRDGKKMTLKGPAIVNPRDLLKGKPTRPVHVPCFFIAKTELTRSQWSRISGTTAPEPQEALLPVTGVSGIDFSIALGRESLLLPTVDQWHFAAGGGSFTKYWTGDTEASLAGAENVPAPSDSGSTSRPSAAVAPVATLEANPLGLYDALGNVAEWCRFYRDRPVMPGSVTLLGGSWQYPFPMLPRRTSAPDAASGVRPAWEIP